MFRSTAKRLLQKSIPKRTERFAAHLTNEIKLESEQQLKINLEPLKKLNFDINVQGAAVELSKQLCENETATVGFSINGAIPADNQLSMDENAPDQDQEAIAVPDFVINMEKKNHNQMVQYECFFPETQVDDNMNYAVRAVLVLEKDEEAQMNAGEPYFINTENIDEDTYHEIVGYLFEKGFNQEFSNGMVEFATGLETDQYIRNLKGVKDYLDA